MKKQQFIKLVEETYGSDVSKNCESQLPARATVSQRVAALGNVLQARPERRYACDLERVGFNSHSIKGKYRP